MARAATEDGMSLEEQIEFLGATKRELMVQKDTINNMAIRVEAYETVVAMVRAMGGRVGYKINQGEGDSVLSQVDRKFDELKQIKREIEIRKQDAANRKATERALEKEAKGQPLTNEEKTLIEASKNRDQP